NRLRVGMMLQTDPTVIYGIGASFDGNLRKKDLQTDTPWNTYTRAGLPPTPIAMPGKAALQAAVAPATSKALYFVARGDGTSQFSATLDEHNRAVNQYQRK
ncbi:MAG TPA: endolytic transglycosylase MltG, partial [Burkholderiaceae bacterium]|nr:endolytic transglycosylase MltG [Burkholderiaceae bacterium]